MGAYRRDWLTQMELMQREMDRLLDHFAGSKPPQVRYAPSVWEPAIDVYETEDSLVVIAELAGVKESDIELVVDRDTFTIRGSRSKAIRAGEKRAYHRMEIASGFFSRSIKLPMAIEIESVKATYAGGLVEVVLPKAVVRRTQRLRIQRG